MMTGAEITCAAMGGLPWQEAVRKREREGWREAWNAWALESVSEPDEPGGPCGTRAHGRWMAQQLLRRTARALVKGNAQ